MKADDYRVLDAISLSELVRRREVAPREVVQAAFDVIDSVNPALNAVIRQDRDGALAATENVDFTAPLAGVPVLIKDNNIYVEGWPTTYSCRFLETSTPCGDSEFVTRLRRAGAIPIGKTNLPEFAADWTTEPTLRGPTRNPWDLSRSPGGSSGGSAAAVASGMTPIAHANDNAGSIRVPAAVCGLFGLKPSRGLVPVGPHFGELANGHNSEFALTRTVRDSALLLDVLAGPECGGRYHVEKSVPSYLAVLQDRPASLRIGLVTKLQGIDVDPEIASAVERCARLLANKKGSITEMEFPSLHVVFEDSETMWAVDAAMLIRQRERELGRPALAHELEALTWHVLERVSKLSAVEYAGVRQRLDVFSRRCVGQLNQYDLVLTPTTAQVAPLIGHFDTRTEKFNYESYGRSAMEFAPFTELFNLTGQPAASVPAALSSSGLPIGIQIAAPALRDALVLQAAQSLADEIGVMRPAT